METENSSTLYEIGRNVSQTRASVVAMHQLLVGDRAGIAGDEAGMAARVTFIDQRLKRLEQTLKRTEMTIGFGVIVAVMHVWRHW